MFFELLSSICQPRINIQDCTTLQMLPMSIPCQITLEVNLHFDNTTSRRFFRHNGFLSDPKWVAICYTGLAEMSSSTWWYRQTLVLVSCLFCPCLRMASCWFHRLIHNMHWDGRWFNSWLYFRRRIVIVFDPQPSQGVQLVMRSNLCIDRQADWYPINSNLRSQHALSSDSWLWIALSGH